MSLNFPTTGLTANQTTYTFSENTWIWNGYAWDSVSVGGTGSGTNGATLGINTFTTGVTGITGIFYNGDRWINTDTGILYTYTVVSGSTAGNAGIWVEYNN